MATPLSTAALEQYHQQGYYHPVPALNTQEVRQLLDQLAKVETERGQVFAGELKEKPHMLFTWLDDLIRNETILAAVEQVIGPDILCWASSFFNKEPQSEQYVSWHQDATYWGLSSTQVVTVWVALTPSTRANGCMRVSPGTHLEQMPHKPTFAENNLLSRGQDLMVDVSNREVVDLVLQPGQCSLHHVLIWHASEANPSTQRRVGFVIRYIATSVRPVESIYSDAVLVRGQDRYGHFQLAPRPEKDLDPAQFNRYRAMQDQKSRHIRETSGAG